MHSYIDFSHRKYPNLIKGRPFKNMQHLMNWISFFSFDCALCTFKCQIQAFDEVETQTINAIVFESLVTSHYWCFFSKVSTFFWTRQWLVVIFFRYRSFCSCTQMSCVHKYEGNKQFHGWLHFSSKMLRISFRSHFKLIKPLRRFNWLFWNGNQR